MNDPVLRPLRKLTSIEVVMQAYAWLVCGWMMISSGLRMMWLLQANQPLDALPFVGFAIGGIGIFLLVCLWDDRRMRR